VRIGVALKLQSLRLNGQEAEQLHRVEGIVVYFGFLLLLYLVSERAGDIRRRVLVFTSEPTSTISRKLAFPLLIYYGTTLALPFLNGAYRNVDFWQHAVVVMVVPLLLVLPLMMVVLIGKLKTS
jgi:hypothetical protein